MTKLLTPHFSLLTVAALCAVTAQTPTMNTPAQNNNAKIKMRPVLDGDFWMIGANPNLGALNNDWQQCVDHHIFKADDGKWHLWGCIRGTEVGRILYHWTADNLTDTHWRQTGEMMRADESLGENVCRLDGKEWIQSPYVVKENGMYYMFYGGHTTEWDAYGRAADRMPYASQVLTSSLIRSQICVMTSKDGLNWKRHLNADGQTRLFAGPGQSRDPMLLKVGDVWHMYVAGAVIRHDGFVMPQIYLRTSVDLLNWSDYQVVHYDYSHLPPEKLGNETWSHECPFVVEHAGYYYLLRTEDYPGQRTHVYRSENPRDFGLGDKAAQAKYVGLLAVGAPEIITDENGQQYITSNHNLAGGTMLCKLRWELDE